MEFECKLAHQDEIKKISGFNSIKELYDKISKAFLISIDKILFCTLNNHNFRDMNSLLGNYLSLGDLIVVHLCGSEKDLVLKKTQQYLGLTITDNGLGRAFVKKVCSEQDQLEKLVKPGDHIAAVNSESTIGMRHYEVAKALREVPQNINFKLSLIEPLHSDKYLMANKKHPSSLIDLNHDRPSISLLNLEEGTFNDYGAKQTSPDNSYEDLIHTSLPINRLLSKGHHRDDQSLAGDEFHNSYRQTIEKINSILESFLGINDNILAIKIYRMARENNDSQERFLKAINGSELAIFNFNEDIKASLWKCAAEASV